MISKEIEGSIKNTPLKKLRLHRREYEWSDAGGTIRNDGPTMSYLLFKSTNPSTRICISNLKDKINKANISKFGNNVKDLLEDIYSNYSIIINKE